MDCLVNLFPEFHKLALSDITSLLIDKWKQRRIEDGRKPSTVNRQMNNLRACLNKAIEWDLIEKNPFEKVKPCKADSNAVVRFLSPDEESGMRKALDEREAEMKTARESANEWRAQRGYPLYSAIDDQSFADHLKPAILISLNTGLRRGELLKLKWRNVDFEQRNLTVEGDTAKAGKTRHIRLNDEALAVLRQWKEQPGVKGVYVFCDQEGKPFHDMRTAWVGLLERAKITDFRWHDLRHTFASKLVIAGVDLNKVRALLGHSDYKMTLRYAHLAPEHMQEAVDRLVSSRAAG
jgi:integrase